MGIRTHATSIPTVGSTMSFLVFRSQSPTVSMGGITKECD